jgi:enamine deaminase RidA (YjgF/YER057c/UK114 family)
MRTEMIDAAARLGPSPGYSYASKLVGPTTVYTAGAVPLDPDGNLVGHGNYEDQTRAAIANLTIALDAAGARECDVVKTTIYVVAGERADLVRVWEVFSTSEMVRAPSTLLGVSFLGYEGQLVEIEAIAAESSSESS